MQRLYFKKKFHKPIREGRKTTTLRRWSKARAWAGRILECPGLGALTVTDCRKVDLKKVDTADALADGFASVSELHKAVAKIYPEHETDGKHWYRVTFRLNVSKPKKATKLQPPRDSDDARSRLALAVRARLDKAVRHSTKKRLRSPA